MKGLKTMKNMKGPASAADVAAAYGGPAVRGKRATDKTLEHF